MAGGDKALRGREAECADHFFRWVLFTAWIINKPEICSAKDIWAIVSFYGENVREMSGLSKFV